jgi:hypothetical protein
VWQPAADNNDRLALFFTFEVCQTAIIICNWLPNPTQHFQTLKIVRQIVILKGLSLEIDFKNVDQNLKN